MKKHFSLSKLPLAMVAILSAMPLVFAGTAPAGVELTQASEKFSEVQKIASGSAKGEVITLKTIQIPAKSTVILKVNMRLLSARPSGWGHYTAIHINGRNIKAFTPKKQNRVLYRTDTMQTSHPKDKNVQWFRKPLSYGVVLTLFGPENTENIDPRVTSDRQAGYDYYFDVTDLVRSGSNTVQFTNHLPQRYKIPLIVKDVQLFYQSGKTPADAALTIFNPVNANSAFQKVAAGNGKSELITFPAIKLPANTKAALKFNLRLLSTSSSGWGHYTAININGKNVAELNAQKQSRILDRNSVMQTTHPKDKSVQWFRSPSNYSYLLTLFGPESTEEIDKRITSDRDKGYDYSLDVTDLLNANGNNTVQFTNHLPKRYKSDLMVKDVIIELIPAK